MKWAFVIVVLALAGCGKGVHYSSIPSEVQPYVDEFNRAASAAHSDARANDVVIQFGDPMGLVDGEVGVCDTSGHTPTITIKQIFWEHASSTSNQILILHELGHCVLHRGHTSDWISETGGGFYKSVMTPYMMSDAQFEARASYYETELFQE